MKVCIGITTKNRKDIVPKAIDSALAQSYSDCEVFVFDDGSTDGTPVLSKHYNNVRWERSEESIGLLEARNYMMRACGADIFVSLDDDAWFLKGDEISKAVDYFQKNKFLGAIAFDILEAGSDRYKQVPRDIPVPTNFFMGAGHALRLNLVQNIGYYAPFPIKYGHEEKDLGIQILDMNYEIWMLPGVHVWHDYTSIARNKSDQDTAFVINDLIYKYRRVPLLYLFPVLGLTLFRTLTNKVRVGVKNKKAVLTFFKLIPSQSKFTKRVQPQTYRKYRNLSKSYLKYLSNNKQK